MTDSIAETLTAGHRRCDHLVTLIESVIDGGRWDLIDSRVRDLGRATEDHFLFEEDTVLYPMAGQPLGAVPPDLVERFPG